mmetsp:Transcript_9696/g.16317  ORF Transcript_9696/g.16317 Transcript_9696/m.16317 type:complete len:116 (+) Transcript_9696:448-795(+)
MSGARSSCSSNMSYIASSAAFREEARMTGQRVKVIGDSSHQLGSAAKFDISNRFANKIVIGDQKSSGEAKDELVDRTAFKKKILQKSQFAKRQMKSMDPDDNEFDDNNNLIQTFQ